MYRLSAVFTTTLLACCAFLEGCSYTYIDAQGTRHVVGLVNLELPAENPDSPFAGQVVDITTLGVAVGSDEDGGSIALGYNREIRGRLRDHALVIGNPLAIQANNKEGSKE